MDTTIAKSPSAVELASLIRRRSSAREPFDPAQRVNEQDLLQILQAAQWAPTAHNMQNFEIIVVDDRAVLQALSSVRSLPSETFLRENYRQLSFSEEELLRRRTGLLADMFPPQWRLPHCQPGLHLGEPGASSAGRAVPTAPLMLIVLYDNRQRAPASEGDVLVIMSLGCVLQNMWLMATTLGIGFQVVSAFATGGAESALRGILGIPAHMRIAFGCRLGFSSAAVRKPLRVRREPWQFLHNNRYIPR